MVTFKNELIAIEEKNSISYDEEMNMIKSKQEDIYIMEETQRGDIIKNRKSPILQ
jgi:hypothetical protein